MPAALLQQLRAAGRRRLLLLRAHLVSAHSSANTSTPLRMLFRFGHQICSRFRALGVSLLGTSLVYTACITLRDPDCLGNAYGVHASQSHPANVDGHPDSA